LRFLICPFKNIYFLHFQEEKGSRQLQQQEEPETCKQTYLNYNELIVAGVEHELGDLVSELLSNSHVLEI
jgi:hypothetical protein